MSDGTLVFGMGAAYDSWDTVLKGTTTADVGGTDNEHELCTFSISNDAGQNPSFAFVNLRVEYSKHSLAQPVI